MRREADEVDRDDGDRLELGDEQRANELHPERVLHKKKVTMSKKQNLNQQRN